MRKLPAVERIVQVVVDHHHAATTSAFIAPVAAFVRASVAVTSACAPHRKPHRTRRTSSEPYCGCHTWRADHTPVIPGRLA
jgi:hypothetical protein